MKSNKDKDSGFARCPECGAKFDDMFSVVDHMLEDDESFDPAFILPGGFKLLLGSLLRLIYDNRDNPNAVSNIVQDCYGTLFAAEMAPDTMDYFMEDVFVASAMENFDVELKKLFKNGE